MSNKGVRFNVKDYVYIGITRVVADLSTRKEHCKTNKIKCTKDQDPNEQGYSVCDYNTLEVSWWPKTAFETTYRRNNEELSFGIALEALKQGYKIYRSGWNGKDQFVQFEPSKNSDRADMMVLYNAQGVWCSWVPSMSDTLAEDWIIGDEVI